uniref:Anillin n=1 Tax=Xenopus laevis TaxID=8355 RepID=ANLN_XENLA|nr:RecName: Full=Anillin [Xenopus laevis]AAO31737.1 contractile ring component anillin [Xenopus laevis]
MDPFTEKLLERTRARRENLQKKMADRPTAGTRTAALNKRPREPLLEANHQPPAPAEEAKPSSKPSPSKRRCSDNASTPDAGAENKQPKTPELPKTELSAVASHQQLRATNQTPQVSLLSSDKELTASDVKDASSVKTRMQKLADQRRYWDNNVSPSSSPPAHVPPKDIIVSPPKPQIPDVGNDTPVGRRGRFANLAATIGSWEDDLSHPFVKPNNKQEKPGTACLSKESTTSSASASMNSHSVKQDTTSCSQRPKDTTVNKAVCSGQLKNILPASKPASSVASTEVSGKSKPLAIKSPAVVTSKPNENVLPASSSLKPVSANSSPQKTERPASRIYSYQSASARNELNNNTPVQTQQKDKVATSGGVGIKSFLERFGEKCQEHSPAPLNQGHRTAVLTPNTKSIQERLLKQNDISSTASLAQQQKKEREKELAALRGRYDRRNVWTKQEDEQQGTFPETSSNLPTSDVASCSETKRAEASGITSEKSVSGHFHPNMAEQVSSPEKIPTPVQSQLPLESPRLVNEGNTGNVACEVEMSVDGSIEEINSSGIITNIFSDVLEQHDEEGEEVDECLVEQVETDTDDEEREDEEEDALNISSMSLLAPLAETVGIESPKALLSPSNKVAAGNGESCDRKRSGRFQKSHVLRAESNDGIGSSEENQNLLYSIDAYRSQRFKETDRPPIMQTIVRKEDVSSRLQDKKTASPLSVNIKQKMKTLSNEVNLQQTVIHQASQALNCCIDEDHGKGSETEAEAERLLIVATEKRAALIAELNKIKNEGPQSQKKNVSNESAPSRGCISVSEMFLPLKADFVCNATQRMDSANYYFFLMIRAGAENIVASPLTSITSTMKGDALAFPTTFSLEDVSNDFEICVEVYSLVQKKEGHAPDKKKKTMKSKAITPKRLLTSITKSNMHTPALASPGGPNAVRTSNFVLVGSHKLTLSSIGSNKFPLDKVPFLSPLEGHIYLKIKCHVNSSVEDKGFLTMFEDVSGFGAWHRRWCVLSGYCISYWTYPDDEKRKKPIGRINLANCTSRKIEPANREFCARPNTFELITVRPQREGDRETLVSQCRDTLCVTKNWLSADTKEERNLWMQKLNQFLVDLRMWQPNACYRPASKP